MTKMDKIYALFVENKLVGIAKNQAVATEQGLKSRKNLDDFVHLEEWSGVLEVDWLPVEDL